MSTESNLTPKQQRFVEEYLVDFNATQAAIRAGYSEASASSQGYDLLRNPQIEVAIAVCREKQSKEINAQWLLNRLAAEANADIADIYNEDGGLKPIKEWPLIWRQGLVAGVESEQRFEYVDGDKVPDGFVKKLKLSDRIRRLELIGKHVSVGAFVEKHEHTGKDGAPLMPEADPAEVARRMLFLLNKGANAASEG